MVVARPESGLVYANADNVHAAIRQRLTDDTHAVVLDLESVPVIDVIAPALLVDLDELTRNGQQLLLAREVGQVRDVLRHAGAEPLADRFHPTVDDEPG